MTGSPIPTGYVEGRTYTPREIWFAVEDRQNCYVPGGLILDSSKAIDGGNIGYTNEIRAGWLLGRITGSGLAVPLKRTRVTAAGGATAATIPVDNAAAFKVGDTITIGGDTGKVITAVDYVANTITVGGGAFTFANSEPVFAEDGSGICVGVTDQFAWLYDPRAAVAVNKGVRWITRGRLRSSMLLGDLAAVLASLSSHYIDQIQLFDSGGRLVKA